MISTQIERLKKDSNTLGNYIKKLEKTGRTDIAYKVKLRKNYLDDRICEIKETTKR